MTSINGAEFFADVSEFQVPVSDAYLDAGYQVISIRANDGSHLDTNWNWNYSWCKSACDEGRLTFFIVYTVWHPDWESVLATLQSLVGTPHPKMVVMLDVETWPGLYNYSGDNSDSINRLFWGVSDWLNGTATNSSPRVIGYANSSDFNELWPSRPVGLRVVGAGYGANPNLPGQIAHQYTDGAVGAGQGLPLGAPPFGNCDMNCADNLTAPQFAAALGVGPTSAPVVTPPPVPQPSPVWTLPDDDSIYAAADVLVGQFLGESS